MLTTFKQSRPASAFRLAVAALFAAVAAGCIPTASRYSHSFRPRIPETIAEDFDFKVRKIRVVDDSYLGTQRSLATAERLKLRFDPRFIDPDAGLDLYVTYKEERLPERIFPDMIPYGFPITFPLMNLILPTVETARYEVSARVQVLDHENAIVHEFDVAFRAYRKSQRGGLLAVLFVTLLPVRGDYAHGSRLPPFHRHEAASRLIVNELAGAKASPKLKAAYKRNEMLVEAEKAIQLDPAAEAVP